MQDFPHTEQNVGETPPSKAEPPSRTNSAFVSAVYWISGALSFTWMTGVYTSACRYYTPMSLPIFGSCTTSEGILFTLMIGWIPIFGAHLAAHAFRQILGPDHNSFDALPNEFEKITIPPSLRSLRLLLFFTLVCLPTILYLSLTIKAALELRVVPKDKSAAGDVGHLPANDPLIAKSREYELNGWLELLGTWRRDEKDHEIDWRWRHQYTEFREAQIPDKFVDFNYSNPRLESFPVLTSAYRIQPYLALFINALLWLSMAVFGFHFIKQITNALRQSLKSNAIPTNGNRGSANAVNNTHRNRKRKNRQN